MDTGCVTGANGAQESEREPAHAVWPGRRGLAACFGAFTIYAGAMAGFAGWHGGKLVFDHGIGVLVTPKI